MRMSFEETASPARRRASFSTNRQLRPRRWLAASVALVMSASVLASCYWEGDACVGYRDGNVGRASHHVGAELVVTERYLKSLGPLPPHEEQLAIAAFKASPDFQPLVDAEFASLAPTYIWQEGDRVKGRGSSVENLICRDGVLQYIWNVAVADMATSTTTTTTIAEATTSTTIVEATTTTTEPELTTTTTMFVPTTTMPPFPDPSFPEPSIP